MTILQWFHRNRSHPAVLIALALLTGGLFKISAFAREAFIAARFGLSAVTDTYFGLQQFPLTLATFMYGSFALAFTPAYANARRRSDSVSWLPGLTLYGVLISSLLTGLMLACAPWLVGLFTKSPTSSTWNTLALVSLCFPPIFFLGIWTGICTAEGHNNRAMIVSGLPYLLMTLTLLGLYGAHQLNDLGLPISMAAGFVAMGLYAFARTHGTAPGMFERRLLAGTWKLPEFRAFMRELTASSIENVALACNQLLILFFLARAGTGAISANNCAMRIGMLGFTLLAQPLAQLVQARLCAGDASARPAIFRRWFALVAAAVLPMALVLYALRFTLIRIVYMHGKFQGAEVNLVAAVLPAWIIYVVIMSLNAIVTRHMFTDGIGSTYVRRQVAAYGAANLLRLAIGAGFGPGAIILCSVATEGIALLANLRTCLFVPKSQVMPIMVGAEGAS